MHKKVVLNMCNKITAGSIILGLKAAFWAYSGRGYRVRLPAVYFVVRIQVHLLVLPNVNKRVGRIQPSLVCFADAYRFMYSIQQIAIRFNSLRCKG